MNFTIQRVNRESYYIVSVGGYMGNDECCKLETELCLLLQHGNRYVILDLFALIFTTTSSLARITKLMRRFRQKKGELKLANLPPFVTRIIRNARLETALTPAVDLAAAVRSLSAARCRTGKQKNLGTGTADLLRSKRNKLSRLKRPEGAQP